MLALQETAAGTLRIETGSRAGRVVPLGAALRIGRHPYNEISLDDAAVSRYHCWILMNDHGAVIEDLASSNGTYVNGKKLAGRKLLKPGDRIRIGRTELALQE